MKAVLLHRCKACGKHVRLASFLEQVLCECGALVALPISTFETTSALPRLGHVDPEIDIGLLRINGRDPTLNERVK